MMLRVRSALRTAFKNHLQEALPRCYSTNPEHQDVVIVGGGIMGSSAAFFLAEQGVKCTVVEKDSSYACSSTALSAASVRTQFSTPECVHMSLFGAQFLKQMDNILTRQEESAECAESVGFQERGYLLLNTREQAAAVSRELVVMQRSCGASVELLNAQETAAKFPGLNTLDVHTATFGSSNEGWFDAYALLQAVRREAVALGVNYIEGEVASLTVEAGRVHTVNLSDSQLPSIHSGTVVNAAGAWASGVARMAGIDDLPVEPRKRCVFVFERRHASEQMMQTWPMLIDSTGVYVRPDSTAARQFITGVTPAAERDENAAGDFDVDHDLFDEIIWPSLAHRVPIFEAIRVNSAWAGHYEYNTLDQNAVIGPHPSEENMIFCNGFSGHGLQHGPAAGRAVAELVLHNEFRSLDLSCFSFERILQGRPLLELGVY